MEELKSKMPAINVSKWRVFLMGLVLLLGMILTGFISYQFKQDIDFRERQSFESRCEEIKLKIKARLMTHKQMLLSGAAMFNASEEVRRDEWKMYVERLSLNRELDGVQAFGFSLWIKPEQLAEHEKNIRQEGFPDYQVKPEGKRNAYTPIVYIEPFEASNLRAFGYDMYSEPIRRTAMNWAMDNQTVSLSGKVTLLQEESTDIQTGTFMYAPVYQKNKPIETVEQRRKAIFGWVYSPFRMTDLLHHILLNSHDVNVGHLHLQVYDGMTKHLHNSAHPLESLLYESEKSTITHDQFNPLFSYDMYVEFYDTTWTLHFDRFVDDEGAIDYSKVWLALSTGTLFSLLAFFLLRAFFSMQIIDARIAYKLTSQWRESEYRFELLANSAPVMIWTSGTDKRFNYVNKMWLDFTGRTLKQLQENGLADDIHPEDLQESVHIYRDAFEVHQPFRVEYRLKRNDGEYRWILDTGVPRFVDGVFIGYVGSCLDITEHYESELALKMSEKNLAMSNADLLQFTHVAAHHLQEPTRRIMIFVQRLQDVIAQMPEPNEDVLSALNFIRESTLRQRALVRDIQLYLAASQPRMPMENVNVGTILTKVLDITAIARLIETTHAQIELGELPSVLMDRPRLYDIFNVLISNALSYHHPDRIPHIYIYGEHKKRGVRYYIEDNGIGIPFEYREQVFLVFERLQVNDDQDSTGVDLAIVRRIMESCNGAVSLCETKYGGTTVILDFRE